MDDEEPSSFLFIAGRLVADESALDQSVDAFAEAVMALHVACDRVDQDLREGRDVAYAALLVRLNGDA